MKVYLAMRHDPDEGSDPVGVYSEDSKAKHAAQCDALEAGIWIEDEKAWYMATTYGNEYSVEEFILDEMPEEIT